MSQRPKELEKLSAQEMRARRERDILKLIPIEWTPWSDIMRQAKNLKVSSATLSRHLQRFVKLGIVERKINTEAYPPATFYRLSPDLDFRLHQVFPAGIFGPPRPPPDEPEALEDWLEGCILLMEAFHALTILLPLLKGVAVETDDTALSSDGATVELRSKRQPTHPKSIISIRYRIPSPEETNKKFAELIEGMKKEELRETAIRHLLLTYLQRVEKAFKLFKMPLIPEEAGP